MKKILSILCAVLFLFSFAGCTNKNEQPSPSMPSQTSEPKAESTPKAPITIACIYSSLEGEFWGIVANGTNAALEELKSLGKISGDSYLVAPSVAGDIEQQKALLGEAIDNKVDGIVLSPAHADEIGAYVSDTMPNLFDGGIPIVVIDRSLYVPEAFDCIITSIVTDIPTMGKECGKLAAEALSEEGEYLFVGINPTCSNWNSRSTGTIDYLDKNAPNLKRASLAMDGIFWVSIAGGVEVIKPFIEDEVLQKIDKKQDLVIIAATEPYTIAVCNAIKESNIKRTGKTMVVGFDFSQEAYSLIQTGELYGVCGQNPYLMGYESTIYMSEYLNDGKKFEAMTPVDYQVVTKATMDADEVKTYLEMLGIKA